MRNPFRESIWSRFVNALKGLQNKPEQDMVKKVRKEIAKKRRKV